MPEKISIMNPREKQVYTWFLVVVLVLFCLATYISRFNPLEVLWEQGEFWKFLFQDFLPPRFNASPVVVESILVTFALAVSSSFVAAVFAFLFAVFGSTSLSPWKGLARTIRGFATFLRNIPTLVWAFILFSSLGIGTGVGFIALLISTFAFMTRAFIEVIDEVSCDAMEGLTACGGTFWQKVCQGIVPTCLTQFIAWFLYCIELNIRASTIVGMVGGGGIGLVLFSYIKSFNYAGAAARVNEQDQFSYYEFLKELSADFAGRAEDTLAKLRQLLGIFFESSKYLLAYSCEESERMVVLEQALNFAALLPQSAVAGKTPQFLEAPGENEGIMTPGKVQYVAAGGDFHKFGYQFHGAMKVLETILRYEYLWTKIRVQGGAYGATARFDRNGTMFFASYRDPKLKESLQAYYDMPSWLEKLELSERELTKYIIGTISGLDTPLTNSMRLEQAGVYHLKQVDTAMRQQMRSEIIDLTNADLQKLAPLIRDTLSEKYLCVVGSSQSIEANKNIFTKTQHI